jgi:hypothetical protein
LTYHLVYDLSNTWPDLKAPLIGLLLTCVCLYVWRTRPGPERVLGLVVGIFGALFAVGATILFVPDYLALRKAVSSGDFSVAEGTVDNYRLTRSGRKGTESYTVAGHHFFYSGTTLGHGFRQTAADGGPIRSGMPVRIGYRGDVILRLEIGEPDKRSP